MSVDVSVVTINYNSTDYTIKMLNSLFEKTDKKLSYEVVVVDNASKDEEYMKLEQYCNSFSNIKLIKNRINSGFSSGNMLGVNYANGKYYLFLNNDTELLNDALNIMKDYLDSHPNIGLLTAQINDENGSFSSSYKLFPSLSKELLGNSVARKLNNNKFPSNKMKLDKPSIVEVVSGSCMFFNAEVFNSIGGFDTGFFLYCEEEDIAKRVWNNGYDVMFIPEAKVYHKSGGSGEQSYELQQEYYISYKHLVFKHFNLIESYILLSLQIFKLFRRSFKRKNGFKLFIFGLFGFKKKESLRYKQKVKNAI
jgi:GT2 family glycosyltransferase